MERPTNQAKPPVYEGSLSQEPPSISISLFPSSYLPFVPNYRSRLAVFVSSFCSASPRVFRYLYKAMCIYPARPIAYRMWEIPSASGCCRELALEDEGEMQLQWLFLARGLIESTVAVYD